MIKICEEFAKEYQLTFNSNKSYCIQFGDRPVGNKTVFMNGEPMEWVSEVKHLGNILSSNLSDKNDVIYKKGQFIGNVNRIIAQFGYMQLPVKCKLFNSYCSVFYGSSLWDLSSAHVSSFCTAWNKAVRILCRLPYRTRTVLLPHIVNTLSMQDQLILRLLNLLLICCKVKIVLLKLLYRGHCTLPIHQ